MPDNPVAHIIDDDDALRDSLSFLLASADIPVATYTSASEFLTALPGIASGCVVTDIRMPGMSGMELLKHLKQGGSALQVIVMTGHGDVPLAVEAMRLGAADFIEKPFDDEMFIASVRMAIARQTRGGSRPRAEERGRSGRSSRSRRASGRCSKGWSPAIPTSGSPIDLGISPRTVEIYRANLMTKMQAGSLSDLVRMALLAGSLPEAGDT